MRLTAYGRHPTLDNILFLFDVDGRADIDVRVPVGSFGPVGSSGPVGSFTPTSPVSMFSPTLALAASGRVDPIN